MKPRRPYLLRALHEWISDSGETPHLVVDAAAEGVIVPRQYVKDGKIVLNVSLSATQAFATNAPVNLVFVADLAKMGNSAPEDKKTYANIDAGYISQNAYLYCASEGLATGARASVDRKALALKLNLRPDQMIVLGQSVGYAKR